MARKITPKTQTGWLNPHSQQGRFLYMVVYLLASYALFSVAIDSGELIYWGGGFFFLGWAVNNIIRLLIVRSKGSSS